MVASFFSAITAFIAEHPHFAYATVLLLALLESVPVIGAVVPGTAVILGISALVPTGIVTLWPLLGAAAAGAILGDGLSFWIGHRSNQIILDSWPVSLHPDLIARSKAFFARHGDKRLSYIPPRSIFRGDWLMQSGSTLFLRQQGLSTQCCLHRRPRNQTAASPTI